MQKMLPYFAEAFLSFKLDYWVDWCRPDGHWWYARFLMFCLRVRYRRCGFAQSFLDWFVLPAESG
jgi:hypothetical protein